MKIELSEQTKTALLGKVVGMMQEGDRTYLTFDRITVDPTAGKVDYFYGGKHIFTMHCEHVPPGAVLTVTGIEGRMEANLTS